MLGLFSQAEKEELATNNNDAGTSLRHLVNGATNNNVNIPDDV